MAGGVKTMMNRGRGKGRNRVFDEQIMKRKDKDLFLNCICYFMTKVCSFCDTAVINESDSVCVDCRRKYRIGSFDNSKDGCGCDC